MPKIQSIFEGNNETFKCDAPGGKKKVYCCLEQFIHHNKGIIKQKPPKKSTFESFIMIRSTDMENKHNED